MATFECPIQLAPADSSDEFGIRQVMRLTLRRRIGLRLGVRFRSLAPAAAYDRWAATYDSQPDNVVFALEGPLFTELLARVVIEKKIVIDIGCGTGRHW